MESTKAFSNSKKPRRRSFRSNTLPKRDQSGSKLRRRLKLFLATFATAAFSAAAPNLHARTINEALNDPVKIYRHSSKKINDVEECIVYDTPFGFGSVPIVYRPPSRPDERLIYFSIGNSNGFVVRIKSDGSGTLAEFRSDRLADNLSACFNAPSTPR